MLYILLLSLQILTGQTKPQIQQTWIRIASDDLSQNPKPNDTSYVRYKFEKSDLIISLNPAWGQEVTRPWKLGNKTLFIGDDEYNIETINDTALIISLPGFRRFSFLKESYLTGQPKNLEQIGDFEGKPLYRATNYVTPRFSETKSFHNQITFGLEEHYPIKRKSLFVASFIVTEKGEVKSVKVENGIHDAFDAEAVRLISKTSKKWTPAYFNGQPIQTKIIFKVQYLDSFSPY